jgi:hypothetical protein
MLYVYVKNNKIEIEPTILPNIWENVSNLSAFSDEEKRAFGWYPYEFIDHELQNNEIFIENEIEYEITDIKVYGRKKIQILSEEEIKLKNSELLITKRTNKEITKEEFHTEMLNLGYSEEYLNNYEISLLQVKRNQSKLSAAQFRLRLYELNLLNDIELAMKEETISKPIKILWEYSTEIERMHPDLISMTNLLGYDENILDTIFEIQ